MPSSKGHLLLPCPLDSPPAVLPGHSRALAGETFLGSKPATPCTHATWPQGADYVVGLGGSVIEVKRDLVIEVKREVKRDLAIEVKGEVKRDLAIEVKGEVKGDLVIEAKRDLVTEIADLDTRGN